MKISIAMATYNGDKYVLEQLQSFEEQTYKPYELIICDDCSTDDTVELIFKFAEKASFNIKVFQNERNLGYAKNFEKAISLCSGDWIALSDHDDKWYNNKLQIIKEKVGGNSNIGLVIHDYDLGDGALLKQDITNINRLRAGGRQPEDMIAGCATVFSRALTHLILPIPKSATAHDVWLHKIIKYAGTTQKLVVDEPLMIYRRHGSNASEAFESTEIKQTRLRKLLFYRVKNPVSNYLRGLSSLEEIKKRLLSEGLDIKLVQRDIDITKARIKIITSPMFIRQYLACKYLVVGHYKNYNGIISFVRDIFRGYPNGSTH